MFIVLPEWLTGEKYLTFATWGLVIATFLLYLDGRSKGKEQRRRWEKEDSDHERELTELRDRWKREDLIRARAASENLIAEMRSQFNDSEMRRARSRFAYSLFQWSPTRFHDSWGPPNPSQRGPGLPFPDEERIFGFFDRLWGMVEQGLLTTDSVDLVFGTYTFNLAAVTEGRANPRKQAIFDLRDRLRSYRGQRSIPEPETDGTQWYWYHQIDKEHIPREG